LEVAREQQLLTDEAHLAHDISDTGLTIFEIGAYVLVAHETEDGRSADKLAPRWRGPYVITHRQIRSEGDIYTCRDLVSNKLHDFRVNLLREFKQAPGSNPLDTALLDYEAYLIDEILDHRFSGPPVAANLQLLIQWTGYDEPSWQAFDTQTRNVKAVHDYLATHKLKRFIPAAYK
jgi:hypothetical protein